MDTGANVTTISVSLYKKLRDMKAIHSERRRNCTVMAANNAPLTVDRSILAKVGFEDDKTASTKLTNMFVSTAFPYDMIVGTDFITDQWRATCC